MSRLQVVAARAEHAQQVLNIIHRSFGARVVLDPPATALTETLETITETLTTHGGLIALRDQQAVGAMLFSRERPGLLGLRRVSVDPAAQTHGVASAMVGVAEDVAVELGDHAVWLHVREELPNTLRFWSRKGYYRIGYDAPLYTFAKELKTQVDCYSAEQTRALAGRLAAILQAGDLLVLSGELGAGKTTFTQGLGEGLGVRGPITSPTFVIARSHPPQQDGPALIHVDAYRLGGAEEIDDLDLDSDAGTSVTVVEWGTGLAEQLNDSHVEIRFEPMACASDSSSVDTSSIDEPPRRITITPSGPRWFGADLASITLTSC